MLKTCSEDMQWSELLWSSCRLWRCSRGLKKRSPWRQDCSLQLQQNDQHIPFDWIQAQGGGNMVTCLFQNHVVRRFSVCLQVFRAKGKVLRLLASWCGSDECGVLVLRMRKVIGEDKDQSFRRVCKPALLMYSVCIVKRSTIKGHGRSNMKKV